MHNELAYYDQTALWGKAPLDYQREILADIKTLMPPDVQTVLDAGCGDGLLTRLLPPDLHVVGLDFSAAALAHVQAPKVLASLVNIPFADASFDLVMANDVLEHLPPADSPAALAELLRVSSRYLIITVPFLENLAAQTTRCPHCGTLYHINHHYRAFALKNILRMFDSHASAKTILFTGALADPLDETARHLRSSLGILANWDLAVCPSCGSHSPLPDPHDSRPPIARSLASCLDDTPYGTLLPDRNEVAVLYDKAPLAAPPKKSHAPALLANINGTLRRLDARKLSQNGPVLLKTDAHDLAPASRIYLEVCHGPLALRVATAPSGQPAHFAVPAWLDFDRLLSLSTPSPTPHEADPLTLSAISKLIDDRLRAREALKEISARKDGAVSLAADLASQLAESNKASATLHKTIESLETRLKEAAAANTAQSIKIDSLLAQHRASRKELLSLRSEKRRLEIERSSLKTSLSRLENNLASATAKAVSLENDLASANAKATSLENDLLLARLPLHRKAWRALKARLKRLGKGPWRSRAENRSLLLAQAEPSVFHHEWSSSPPSRRFLMLCHDQSIDRRIIQQAHTLLSAGYRGIIVALSFDGDDAVDSCDGVPVHRIGLGRLVPDCPVYWRYQNRQRLILWWGRQFSLLSWLNWKLYKLDLALVYRNSRINHPLPFDNAFHAAARLYPTDLVIAHDLPALKTARLLASDWKAALVYDSHELYSEQAGFSRAQKRMLDRRITAEADALAADGYDVTLLSLPLSLPHHDLSPVVTLVTPPLSRAPRPSGPVARIRSILSRTMPSPVYDFARRAYRFLKPGDPLHMRFLLENAPPGPWHFIHCHDLDTLPAGLEIRNSLAPSARLIYDSHELFPYQLPSGNFQRRWRSIEARHIHSADAVLTVNPSIADHLSRSYGIPQPTVIYNSSPPATSPPVSDEEFLAHFDAPPCGFRVLFQGSFTAGRNLENLVQAFSLLDPSVHLFMLGAGPLEKRLLRLAARSPLPNVHFGPWLPQRTLLAFTARADLGVIPYDGSRLLNNLYSTPNKLFEFIETLVPVCSAPLPEVKRLVETNSIGRAYPMANAREIADSITDCRSRCLRGDFPSSSRREARLLFSWQKQSQLLLELYRNLGE